MVGWYGSGKLQLVPDFDQSMIIRFTLHVNLATVVKIQHGLNGEVVTWVYAKCRRSIITPILVDKMSYLTQYLVFYTVSAIPKLVVFGMGK